MTTNETQQDQAPASSFPQELLGAVRWRCIGPPRGGRVVAVTGDPVNPMVFYFGACAGGVWKTTDGGSYWENVSDGFFKTASVGAIAVAGSDPNVIYAGMGESCIRGDVTYGDGVYRSTDGGQTWTNMGLSDTRHIARVRVHPSNPDLVYVAALGHAYGPNEERGIFRSRDGGNTWERVLFRSENAGAADLSLDPNNPRILYASIWETRRTPWSLTSGGPESGIFKSVDGGDSWTEITDNSGLPGGLKGRIGVAVSPPNRGGCGPPSRPRTAACTAPTTEGIHGSWSATTGTCKGVPGTTSTSSPTRRTRTRCGFLTTSAGSPLTGDAASTGSPRPTATTTTFGLTPTILDG